MKVIDSRYYNIEGASPL